jgi:hypothetical protein
MDFDVIQGGRSTANWIVYMYQIVREKVGVWWSSTAVSLWFCYDVSVFTLLWLMLVYL